MKVIIAEKPSVGREIARIVGARNKKEGYIEGNGYTVTWAFGHLVALALPEAYGAKGFKREHLPIIPNGFILEPRRVLEGKVYKPDSGAVAQLKVIQTLFDQCDSIIVATDAGREGELIFRYIYQYLGCKKPFERLWISSLTEKAIREGFSTLRKGTDYDRLYHAARARSQTDWLVGINATQAISIAAGRGTYSLGRVQTPTLAMVCARYLEHKRFAPQPYWQLSIGVPHNGKVIRLNALEKWTDKPQAEALFARIKKATQAVVETVEHKKVVEEPPLLYDLTSLQKAANTKYGFSADTTLSLAQKLYEGAYITYPRTGSRYISQDVFATIPSLAPEISTPNRRSVDDSKVTDHHALLPTDKKPLRLNQAEQMIYDMVVARMREAFSEPCLKEATTTTVACADTRFVLKGTAIQQLGWRGVLKELDDQESAPDWHQGAILTVGGCSLAEKSTQPKPLHTEASWLAAMEGAGKELEDSVLKNALKDCGIGTPATRASVIETLLTRGYLVRDKKSLLPTEKGLAIYSIVRQMRIADVEMTGQWEAVLTQIEAGTVRADTFQNSIEVYTKQITTELLASKTLFPRMQ